MKKKIAVSLILSVLSLGILTACGGNDTKTIDGSVNTNVTSTEKEEVAEVTEKKVETTETKSTKGYVFETGNIAIEIDAEASSYIEALGEPMSYFEAASCAFQGLDKMYTYSSFELDTYPTDDKDYVSAVIFKDDSITTPEGIRIGSSTEDVIAAYGDDYSEDIGQMTYSKDGMTLTFIVNDGKVASIEYNSTVLN